MRCVPTSPAETTTKRGHRNRSRAKRASLWSVWLSVFRRFTHFANNEDDSQSMRIPTDVCDACDVCDENTSLYVLSRTRARARDRPSCVSFNVSSIARAHLWEKGSKTVQQVGVTFKHPSHPGHDVIRG